MKGPLVALLLFTAMVGLYIFLYILNKKVKKPEGCEEDLTECGGCGVLLCPKHPSKKEEKEKSL